MSGFGKSGHNLVRYKSFHNFYSLTYRVVCSPMMILIVTGWEQTSATCQLMHQNAQLGTTREMDPNASEITKVCVHVCNHYCMLYYTGFPCSCNNVLLRNVITTCAVKIKWPFNMRLQDLLLQAKSVTVQVLAPSQNSKQITSLW